MGMDFIDKELAAIDRAGLRRTLTAIQGPQGARVRTGGREAILLCSNDYLGLASHPALKEAAIRAVERWGAGSGASRSVSGTMEPHTMLEERISEFKGAEAALVFNSGYHANLSLITALAGRTTEVFSDRLDHASLIDACTLSRARMRRYPHRDVDALEGMLKRSAAERRIIVTDGVFSMDGDIAPVNELSWLLDRFDALLIVDDAHGTGVLGETGRGTLEHLGVSHPSIIQVATLGKALGSFGGFIAGEKRLIDLLINRARPFIYTTALPPAVCASATRALGLIDEEPELVERLRSNSSYMRAGLKRAGLEIPPGETPIIPLLTGDAERAMEMSRALLERGVFIQGIRPPSVPEGASRLRITVTAAHSRADLDAAISAISNVAGA